MPKEQACLKSHEASLLLPPLLRRKARNFRLCAFVFTPLLGPSITLVTYFPQAVPGAGASPQPSSWPLLPEIKGGYPLSPASSSDLSLFLNQQALQSLSSSMSQQSLCLIFCPILEGTRGSMTTMGPRVGRVQDQHSHPAEVPS